jgi:hypothetical protein
MLVFCFADLFAEKVTIKAKSLTMRGLLIEAARQVNKIVLIEADDPSLVKKYYDCEVEFESVIAAYLSYFKRSYGVTLVRSDRRDVLVLGLNDEDRQRIKQRKIEAQGSEIQESRKSRKSLWERMFAIDEKQQPQEKKPTIKKMIYPENAPKEVEREVDLRMKIEILSEKPFVFPNQSKKDDLEPIQLKIKRGSGLKINKNKLSKELPNLEPKNSSSRSPETKHSQKKTEADQEKPDAPSYPDL